MWLDGLYADTWNVEGDEIGSGLALASRIAWRNDPAPVSFVLTTANVAARSALGGSKRKLSQQQIKKRELGRSALAPLLATHSSVATRCRPIISPFPTSPQLTKSEDASPLLSFERSETGIVCLERLINR